MTLSFRKTCSPTQDLKSMYQFLASLLVLVSVVSLTTQGKKNYDLEFGHFLVSVKTELWFLFFCSFSSCSYMRERTCGGTAGYSPINFFFFLGGELDDISHIPLHLSVVM